MMSCQNPSEKVSFEWSDPIILFVHTVRSLIELYRQPIRSVGEHRSAKWEVMGSNNGWTNNQGLQKTGEIMLICWL